MVSLHCCLVGFLKCQLQTARQLLADSWQLMEKSPVEEATKIFCFGRLAVRCTLHLVNKEKMGNEPKGHENMQAIATLFAEELSRRMHTETNQTQDESQESELQIHNLLEAKPNQVALLKNNHMTIGDLQLGRKAKGKAVVEQLYFFSFVHHFVTICIFLPLKAGKLYYIHDLWLGCWPVSLRYTCSKEHGSKVFHFKEITDSHCLLVHNQIFEKEEEFKVPFEDLKLWRKHKGHVQALASNEMVEARLLSERHPMIQEELNKAKVQQVLLDQYVLHQMSAPDFAFSMHPSMVYVLATHKKKALKLVPWGLVSKAKGDVTNKVLVKAFGCQWVVTPFKSVSDFSPEKLKDKSGVLSPYHWVKGVPDDKQANMQQSLFDVEGIKIPCFSNSRALVAHEPLHYHLPPANPAKKAKLGWCTSHIPAARQLATRQSLGDARAWALVSHQKPKSKRQNLKKTCSNHALGSVC